MKKLIITTLLATAFLAGCSSANVDVIKANATKVWTDNGFEVVGYEGYIYGGIGGTWGGCVWYVVKRESTTYHGCISKWGSEYHIYELRALNAIKGD